MATITQATHDQLKLITRIIGDVADSELVQQALAGLDKEAAERLKGNPEFSESLRQYAVQKITELSVTNQFVSEKVASIYGYLSGYKGPVMYDAVAKQIVFLQKLFPGLGSANEGLLMQIKSGEIELPNYAEGWFAVPNIWKPGGLPIFGKTYSEAFQKVLDTIKKTRNSKFHNYREGQINEKRLRQSARTKEFFEKLSETQGHPDILIVPAQFGIRHRGRSVRRAREVMLDVSSEFGLGAFAVGIMLLTHPERLKDLNDLWIDCSGDEFDDPVSGVRFDHAPCFRFYDDRVKFDARAVGRADGRYGTASGVLPQ